MSLESAVFDIKCQFESTDDMVVIDTFNQLQPFIDKITPAILKSTQLGIQINKLRKHTNPIISDHAKLVLNQLKHNVKQSTATSNELMNNNSSPDKTPAQSTNKRSSISIDRPAQPAKKPFTVSSDAATINTPPPSTTTTTTTATVITNTIPKSTSTINQELNKTGDNFRNTIQRKLYDGLLLDGDPGQLAVDLAVSIEYELYQYCQRQTSTKYKTKYRELAMNICDINNPDLRELILSGELSINELLHKPITELASKQVKAERQAEQQEYESIIFH